MSRKSIMLFKDDRQLSPLLVLAEIIVLAVLLRVASAILMGDTVVALPGIQDQVSYDALARRVLAGHGFSFDSDWWPLTKAGEPTAHWSFIYTLYLTAIYGLFGHHPLVARIFQAVVAGILLPWLTWRIGRRIFGDMVGLVAAAISAIYAYFFYYAGALMTETFYILGILWTIDVAMRIAGAYGSSNRKWRLWIELGLALGLTILLRQLFLLFIPVLFLWLLWVAWKRRPPTAPWRSLIPGFLISSAVVVMLILPWTIRNYLAFDRLVPLNTNSGYAFFWANHPIHGINFISILPEDGLTYGELIPVELRSLDEAAMDQALLGEGLHFVIEDPVRYVLLSLSRIKDYFMFWPSPNSGTISNVARVASFGVFLPFMVYGLFKSRTIAKSRDLSAQNSPPTPTEGLTLLESFVVVYTAIHLLSWALIRYRLPVDLVLIIFAAVGVVQMAARLGAIY